jgi:hypothetical protein
LSKVITTAPASPVPANSRSFAASSVSLNWGRVGFERQRQRSLTVGTPHLQGGFDHRAVAEVDAIEVAHRDHGSLGDQGCGRAIADNGKAKRHFEKFFASAGDGFSRGTVTWRPPGSQAGPNGSPWRSGSSLPEAAG